MEEKTVTIPEVGCAHDAPALFENDEHGWKIRSVVKDGEPWFVAKDACSCLGTDTNNLPAILEDDERDLYTIEDTSGRQQQMTIISEPGIYSLVLRSRKPEAKAFRRWVTHEVLPSIRKTGSYSLTPVSAGFEANMQGVLATCSPAQLAVISGLTSRAQLAIEERDAQAARADAEAARAEQEKARAHKAYGGKGGLRASLNRQKRRTEVAEARAIEAEADAARLAREKEDMSRGFVSGWAVLRDRSIFRHSEGLARAVSLELKDMMKGRGLTPSKAFDPIIRRTANIYPQELFDELRARIDADPDLFYQWRVRPRRMALLDLTRSPVSSSTIQ